MSEGVRAGLAEQRQSCDFCDVVVRFCIEEPPEQQREEDGGCARPRRFVGDPYPAHRIILSLGSTFLEAKLKRSCWQATASRASHAVQPGEAGSDCDDMQAAKRRRVDGEPGGILGDAGGELALADSSLPEVLVLLSSEDEEPFARQAIDFIYTGSLSADLDFEALLQVRQQACYLGVKHCAQACDEAMLAWLPPQQQQRGAGPSTSAAVEPRVLQAYACHALFPQPGTSPEAASFQPVCSALAKEVVSHFGDAVAALSRPDLYKQLLQLPALAVKELLAADDFGTDSEDSAFLLLAAWLEAQQKEEEAVPEATRAELCSLVRLHRLSSTYLSFVLPAYEPFVISRAELGHLLRYAGAATEEEKLFILHKARRLVHWYCSPARRQVLKEGRTVEWSISREQLERGLREVVESQEPVCLSASFGSSAAAMYDSNEGTHVFSRGLSWGLDLKLQPFEAAGGDGTGAPEYLVGVRLHVSLPRPLDQLDGVAPGCARIVVNGWRDGQREKGWAGERTLARPAMRFGQGWNWMNVLKLQPAADVEAGGPQAPADLAVQLARWSRWLHDGKITGSITFYAP